MSLRAFLFAAVVVLTSSCFAPRFENGHLACANDGRCPSGFVCWEGDRHCYKADELPDASVEADVDLSVSAGDAATMDANTDLAPPCKSSSDCTGGRICGLTTPGVCSACMADSNCTADPVYGAGTSCRSPGICTSCDAVTDGTYHVDPVNGNDDRASGSGTEGGAADPTCSFKTVTRALRVVGRPTTATAILIRGPATVSAGETFPINIPTLTTILGTTSGSPAAPDVTVLVPQNAYAFSTSRAGAGLSSLILDGKSTAAAGAIWMGGNATVTIQDTTIKDLLGGDGIYLSGSASLTVPHGLVVTGLGAVGSAGINLAGNSKASVSGTSTQPTIFANNGGEAIGVTDAAAISVHGVPNGISGDGTVVVKDNYYSVFINQTPAPNLPQNLIDGLVSVRSTAAWGVGASAGSNVKVRNSVLLGNVGSGLTVGTWYEYMGPGRNDDVSLIDFGQSGDPGNNVVQDASSLNANGICLNVNETDVQDAGVPQTLKAQGNIFSGHNCATGTPSVISGDCSNGVDVGVTTPGNKIDVTGCTCSTPSVCQ